MIPQKLYDQLRRDEGIRLKPYLDTTGHLTIGIGRNLDAVGITVGEAELLLQNDLQRIEADLRKRIPWAAFLDEARYGVVMNMAFNLGVGGLLGFKRMLTALCRGDYTSAALEMLDSRWATQVGGRATRLAKQAETGTWQ